MSADPVGFDLDQHARALRQRGAEVIFTSAPKSNWYLRRYQVKRFLLERRHEGGASIIAGILSHDSIAFAFTLKGPARGAVLNGQRVVPLDLVVVPPALRLIKASPGPNTWIFVSVSQSDLATIDGLSHLAPLFSNKEITVIRSPILCRSIIEAAVSVEREFDRNVSEGRHLNQDDLENRLAEALSEVAQVARMRVDTGRRSTRAYDLAHGAIKLIGEVDPQHWQVNDFCSTLGASPRDLRRSFKTYFAMGPTKFAKLHKVNWFRRLLVNGANQDIKILDLLAAADISEPGRFSGQYKAVFGESPSTTRKRLLVQSDRSAGL